LGAAITILGALGLALYQINNLHLQIEHVLVEHLLVDDSGGCVFRASWPSNGATHGVSTARKQGEPVPDWVDRHAGKVEVLMLRFPSNDSAHPR